MEERYLHEIKLEDSIISKRFDRQYERFIKDNKRKKFPIMIKSYSSEKFYIPWGLIALHEEQAQRNHSQDLKTLASRGGLDWGEAYAVLTDTRYPRREEYISEEYYEEKVKEMCRKWFERWMVVDMEERHLFKAKRLDNGEWVIGNLILSEDAEDGWEAIIIPTSNSNMYTKGGTSGALSFEIWHRVNKDTICQCTGLIDKNRKLFWENDIVLYKGRYAPVKFGMYQASCNQMTATHQGFYLSFPEETCYRSDLGYWKNKVEDVGNIFDNPELLGGTESGTQTFVQS